jgi:hypothetical protein
MPQLLIEENFRRIDSPDMEALIAALADLSLDAQPTEPRMIVKADWWVLVLHWLGDESHRDWLRDEAHTIFDEAMAVAIVDKVRKIFAGRRSSGSEGQDEQDRTPPRRIEIYGPNGQVLKVIEVDDADQ